MAELYAEVAEEEERLSRPQPRQYWDRKTFSSYEEQQQAIARSATLYVGNLSFFTSENQIYELFSRVGTVRRVIMGLDRKKKTPCGFCFVEYMAHDEATAASAYLSETKLDNRIIRCEMDGGFREGRQFGRGISGGQVRDDRRSKDEYDPGRGGFGRSVDANDVATPYRSHYMPGKRSRGESDVDDTPRKAQDTGKDTNPRFQERDEDMKDDVSAVVAEE